MHILVVDDEEGIRKLLKVSLEEYRVTDASDGEEALKTYGRSVPTSL